MGAGWFLNITAVVVHTPQTSQVGLQHTDGERDRQVQLPRILHYQNVDQMVGQDVSFAHMPVTNFRWSSHSGKKFGSLTHEDN